MINGLINPNNVNKTARFLLNLDVSHIDTDFKPNAKLAIANFKDAWVTFYEPMRGKYAIEQTENHLCVLVDATKALAAILNEEAKRALATYLCQPT